MLWSVRGEQFLWLNFVLSIVLTASNIQSLHIVRNSFIIIIIIIIIIVFYYMEQKAPLSHAVLLPITRVSSGWETSGEVLPAVPWAQVQADSVGNDNL